MGMISSLPWKPIKGHSRAHVLSNIMNYEEAFSARYKAAYMWFLVQSIEKEIEGKTVTQNWQLPQRKWSSYQRPLKQGILYVLSKRGRTKWKKRYCVLQPDYSLEIYKSKEDFENLMKPRCKAVYSGFLVTGDVDGHLHEKLTISARDFGYVNPDMNAFAQRVTLIGAAGRRPTQHIFLVDHPWRGTTYFAAETAIEKDLWLKVFKDGIRHLDGCRCEDQVGKEAFAFAVEQSVRLQEFYVDRSMLCGTQEEVLTDLISAFQIVDCREVVIPRMTGGIVNKHKAWNFVMSCIHEIINGVVTKQYLAWKKVWEDNCHSHREKIIENMDEIKKAYQHTAQVIRKALAECFDPIVEEKVLTRLPEIVNMMCDSLVSIMRTSRPLFKTLVDVVRKQIMNSPEFLENIDDYFQNNLDFAPRDPEFAFPSGEISTHRESAPLVFLQNLFPNTDFNLYVKSVYTYQQQLLDSAVHAFESLFRDAVKDNENNEQLFEAVSQIEEKILKNLDYDILLAQKRFCRTVLLSATMESARTSIEQHCKPKMLEFEATIPEDLRCYLPINNVFTDVLTKRFGELVNPALASCMKRIGRDTLASYAFRPGNKVGSLSSFATIDSEDEYSKLSDITGDQMLNSVEETTARTRSDYPTLYSPSTPGVASQAYFENYDGSAGDMDGETGEWFPSSSYKKEEPKNGKIGGAQNESDSDASSSSGSEEYSERRSKELAKEFLDKNFRVRPDFESSASETAPTIDFSPCSMFLQSAVGSLGTVDAEVVFNGNGMMSEIGEPATSANDATSSFAHADAKALCNGSLPETSGPMYSCGSAGLLATAYNAKALCNGNGIRSETGEPMHNGIHDQKITKELSNNNLALKT